MCTLPTDVYTSNCKTTGEGKLEPHSPHFFLQRHPLSVFAAVSAPLRAPLQGVHLHLHLNLNLKPNLNLNLSLHLFEPRYKVYTYTYT